MFQTSLRLPNTQRAEEASKPSVQSKVCRCFIEEGAFDELKHMTQSSGVSALEGVVDAIYAITKSSMSLSDQSKSRITIQTSSWRGPCAKNKFEKQNTFYEIQNTTENVSPGNFVDCCWL